jgi:hypothetical protein
MELSRKQKQREAEAHGLLTRSQTEHSKYCGVRPYEYIQMLQTRIEERKIVRDATRRKDKKVSRIEAENPFLLVAGGPSTDKYLQDVKNFKGKIVAFEISFKKVVDIGIIPDYVMSLEKAVQPKHFPIEYLEKCAGKSEFVTSSITRETTMLHLRESNANPHRYITHEEPRLSNVGLWSLYYCRTVLNADKICLLGFEHEGTGYEQIIYDEWIADFWHYIDTWPKDVIVNCSNGGRLYSDRILDSTLKRLKIGNKTKG